MDDVVEIAEGGDYGEVMKGAGHRLSENGDILSVNVAAMENGGSLGGSLILEDDCSLALTAENHSVIPFRLASHFEYCYWQS